MKEPSSKPVFNTGHFWYIFGSTQWPPLGPVSHALMDGSELQLVEVPEAVRKASVESDDGASTERKFLTR